MDIIKHNRDENYGLSLLFMEKTGKAFGRIYKYRDDRLSGYIEGLSVEKDYRETGLGNEMLRLLEKEIKSTGAWIVYLWVDKDSWMHEWYKRHGYIDYGINVDEENCIWMRKDLAINNIEENETV